MNIVDRSKVIPTREPNADSDQAGVVGQRLRHVRRIRGLRLKELGEMAGCSESMLSKIETGRVNPSLTLLRRLVDALGINIVSLFEDGDESPSLVHRAGTRPMIHLGRTGAKPSVVLERLMPYADDFLLEATIHNVNPGGSSAGPTTHVGEEVGYVLDGELELIVGDETVIIRRGDSFCFRSENPHSYRNVGTVPARILWVNTPPTF